MASLVLYPPYTARANHGAELAGAAITGLAVGACANEAMNRDRQNVYNQGRVDQSAAQQPPSGQCLDGQILYNGACYPQDRCWQDTVYDANQAPVGSRTVCK